MKKYAIFAFLWSEKNEKQQLQYLKIISLSNYLPVPVLRYGSKVHTSTVHIKMYVTIIILPYHAANCMFE